PQGLTGATGPQGPQGPQGPAGTPATFDALYAGVNTTTTVPADTIIPLTQLATTPTTTLSVTNNSVNLPTAGTYLVSYSANGTSADNTLTIQLLQNGTAISTELISSNTTSGNQSLNKTILLTTTEASTLSLNNASADTATLISSAITVQKLA
ncbi:MAG: hypothetical protein IKA99_01210, partial [Clostridia bacterium]|nr:hypothetical protein [Clostridia bacterium]